MKSKILTSMLVCLIVVSFSLNVFSANEIINEISNVENNQSNSNDTNNITENKTLSEQKQDVDKKIEESNSKLEYVKSELGTTLQKVVELDDSITKYQDEYEGYQVRIEQLETEINKVESELEELEQVYEKKEQVLRRRIVALYEAGDTSYIDVLLTSTSIIDFISNYFMISELLEYDNNLLNDIENMQKELEGNKKKQEERQIELKTTRNKVTQTQIQLENTKIVKANYAIQLTEEEKQIQEEIEQYKAQQAELEQKMAESINWEGTYSIQFTGGVFIWPIAMSGTFITSSYGNRLHPIQGVYKNHNGIDISGANVNGGPAVAAADGIVTYSGWISGYGNCIIINHGSGIVTLYGHGLATVAKTGDIVKQGDVVLAIGSTGNSTGPHLHFEVRKNGVPVDPIPYLNGQITNETEENTLVISNVVNTITIN